MQTQDKPFDPTKPFTNRAKTWYSCRLLATDLDGAYPIVVAYKNTKDSEECISTFTKDGIYMASAKDKNNLINIPVKHKRKGWMNIYKDFTGTVQDTKEDADAISCCNERIACVEVEIEYEEGQGL